MDIDEVYSILDINKTEEKVITFTCPTNTQCPTGTTCTKDSDCEDIPEENLES